MKFREPDEHWANELSEDAKQKFAASYRAFPCEKIAEYAADRDERAIYWALRDAGLFRDRTCIRHVSEARVLKSTEVELATRFYQYILGDTSQLDSLLKMFDELGDHPGDSLLIELFGFLPDWNETGRRLARATAHSDGAGSEALSTAFQWKRFIYGKAPGFVADCRRVATDEHVAAAWLGDMCGKD